MTLKKALAEFRKAMGFYKRDQRRALKAPWNEKRRWSKELIVRTMIVGSAALKLAKAYDAHERKERRTAKTPPRQRKESAR